jgi:hypothetical protein
MKGFFMNITTNSPTFKAHFTKNTEFMKLLSSADSNDKYLQEMADKFAKLPEHEIEIINRSISSAGYIGQSHYALINRHNGAKFCPTVIHNSKSCNLSQILHYFFLQTPEKLKAFFEFNNPKVKLLHKLTKI